MSLKYKILTTDIIVNIICDITEFSSAAQNYLPEFNVQ